MAQDFKLSQQIFWFLWNGCPLAHIVQLNGFIPRTHCLSASCSSPADLKANIWCRRKPIDLDFILSGQNGFACACQNNEIRGKPHNQWQITVQQSREILHNNGWLIGLVSSFWFIRADKLQGNCMMTVILILQQMAVYFYCPEAESRFHTLSLLSKSLRIKTNFWSVSDWPALRLSLLTTLASWQSTRLEPSVWVSFAADRRKSFWDNSD